MFSCDNTIKNTTIITIIGYLLLWSLLSHVNNYLRPLTQLHLKNRSNQGLRCHFGQFEGAVILSLDIFILTVNELIILHIFIFILLLTSSRMKPALIKHCVSLICCCYYYLYAGVIFGAIACVEVTCDLIGTVVFNSVYSSTLFISTGFVFLVMAAFYAAGTVIVWWAILLAFIPKKCPRR